MRKSLDKKLVVRITEDQYRRLQQNILDDKVSMSQVIREALRNKLNKIEIDDTWKRKFRIWLLVQTPSNRIWNNSVGETTVERVLCTGSRNDSWSRVRLSIRPTQITHWFRTQNELFLVGLIQNSDSKKSTCKSTQKGLNRWSKKLINCGDLYLVTNETTFFQISVNCFEFVACVDFCSVFKRVIVISYFSVV